MNEKYGIGQSVSRFEDPRLLRGEGRFINDMVVPGMAHIAYVRSPHARARIVSIDAGRRARRPGRARRLHHRRPGARRHRHHGALAQAQPPGRQADALARASRASPREWCATSATRSPSSPRKPWRRRRTPPSCVAVDFDVLPAGDPVWDECPDNVSNVFEVGNRAATDAAFAARGARRQAALHGIARARPVHGAARRDRRMGPRAQAATRCTATCSIRTACAKSSPAC